MHRRPGNTPGMRESSDFSDAISYDIAIFLSIIGRGPLITLNKGLPGTARNGLGVVFGDAFVQKMGFRWVAVEDEIDRTPAIQDVGTATILFPLPMIQKRMLRSEPINIRLIFADLCAKISDLRGEGIQLRSAVGSGTYQTRESGVLFPGAGQKRTFVPFAIFASFVSKNPTRSKQSVEVFARIARTFLAAECASLFRPTPLTDSGSPFPRRTRRRGFRRRFRACGAFRRRRGW